MEKYVNRWMIVALTVAGILFIKVSSASIDVKEQAWSYFQQGERYFQERRFEDAISSYLEALQLVPDDGPILLEENITKKFVPNGRGIQEQLKTSSVDYLPNERIQSIEKLRLKALKHINPPNLELQWVTLQEPTHDNILDGGETGTIVLSIKNHGKGPASNVVLEIEADSTQGLQFEKVLRLLDFSPSEHRIIRWPVKVAKDIQDANRSFRIQAKEEDGFDSSALLVSVKTLPHRPPKLEIADIRIEGAVGDNRIEPSELITMVARIKNLGDGVADDVQSTLSFEDKNIFFSPDTKPTYSVGALFPGEFRDVEYMFMTNRRITTNFVGAQISINHQSDSRGIRKKVKIPLYIAPPKPIAVKPSINRSRAQSEPAVADIDAVIPIGRHKNEHAVAVVIGNQHYQASGVPHVNYAINDAEVIQRYLVNTLGYREHNIIYLEDATAAKFNETFGNATNFAGKLYNYVKPGESDVFIYYSGHGAPDTNDALNPGTYFVPVDVNPTYIATSGYSLEVFYKNLAQLPARNITVVLDTCFSGAVVGGSLINAKPTAIKTSVYTPSLPNAVIFASATGTQISSWYNEKKHGLFTYFFLKGLGGEADNNSDNKVTTGEMELYLKKNVTYQARRLNGLEQTPMVIQGVDKLKELILVEYPDKLLKQNMYVQTENEHGF